nr:MAG TPA: hypothetical protein [Bacteriophage sp.]DAK34536.1 MAG TPA: hypothetical protein [Bacteriophage sp.]DAU14589.1 MAG TPA: hypothetical protein [Caudoviricetes sp.]
MSLSFCYLFVIIDVSNLYVLICANQNRSTQLVLIFYSCKFLTAIEFSFCLSYYISQENLCNIIE